MEFRPFIVQTKETQGGNVICSWPQTLTLTTEIRIPDASFLLVALCSFFVRDLLALIMTSPGSQVPASLSFFFFLADFEL